LPPLEPLRTHSIYIIFDRGSALWPIRQPPSRNSSALSQIRMCRARCNTTVSLLNLPYNPKVSFSPWSWQVIPVFLSLPRPITLQFSTWLAPFAAATLPGVAPPVNKTAYMGDFSQAGNPPALVTVTPSYFHLSGNVSTVVVGDGCRSCLDGTTGRR
jgi:hypothetical protein